MKTVNLELVGLDSNIFAIFGAFQNQARKEGWTKEEIDEVINEAKNGDYDHALATISDHCLVEDEEDSDLDDYEINPETKHCTECGNQLDPNSPGFGYCIDNICDDCYEGMLEEN